jgi:hypothetical protein
MELTVLPAAGRFASTFNTNFGKRSPSALKTSKGIHEKLATSNCNSIKTSPSPKGDLMHTDDSQWKVYRTRFLVKAKQLTEPFSFINGLGYKHSGKPGDYLVEWSYGVKSILPRRFFEDVYVCMGAAEENWSSPRKLSTQSVGNNLAPDRRAAAS